MEVEIDGGGPKAGVVDEGYQWGGSEGSGWRWI